MALAGTMHGGLGLGCISTLMRGRTLLPTNKTQHPLEVGAAADRATYYLGGRRRPNCSSGVHVVYIQHHITISFTHVISPPQVMPFNVSQLLANAPPGQACPMLAWTAYWTMRTHGVPTERCGRGAAASQPKSDQTPFKDAAWARL